MISRITIVEELCVGCGLCVKACPFGAIEIKEDIALIKDNCTLCGACVESCKFNAIILREEKEETGVDTSSYRGVWVYVEENKGEVASVSLELIGKGRELADELGCELAAVVFCEPGSFRAEELIKRGVDKVYLVEDTVFAIHDEECYATMLEMLVRKYKPEILLAGATLWGRSVIPRLAVKLRAGLTADCTGLSIDTENRLLLQTRPAFGGNIMATITCPSHRPQMATVRHKVFPYPPLNGSRNGEIIVEKAPNNLKPRVKLVERIEELEAVINIADADIIVSGGRGLGSKENFKLIWELAQKLGAAVGASRGAVDLGWCPYTHQVGQTGKTVAPKLYFAIGISGAIQHLVGMQSSKCIIAINKDPNAPIFKVSHYGIVGDLFEVVPELIKKL